MRKERLFKLLGSMSGAVPLPWLIKASRHTLLVPMWHTVTDEVPPHIVNLYPVYGVRAFEEQLEWLLKYFRPVSLTELIGYVSAGKLPEKPIMHLTFDDGLRECAEIIAPVLIKRCIPATFFISPHFIGNHHLFYRFKASVLAEALHKPGLPGSTLSVMARFLVENGLPVLDPVGTILSIPYPKRELLDELADILGVDFQAYLKQHRPYMDEAGIRYLQNKGFDIGAHSIDHPNFGEIPVEEQLHQVQESIEYISACFAPRHKAFAFPFTDHLMGLDFFSRLAASPSAPEITFGTSGLRRDIAPCAAQRVPMEMPGMNVPGIVFSEYLYYLLKEPFGRNLQHRK